MSPATVTVNCAAHGDVRPPKYAAAEDIDRNAVATILGLEYRLQPAIFRVPVYLQSKCLQSIFLKKVTISL